MSKKVILGVLILVCLASVSFAVSNPDGVYHPTAKTALVAPQKANNNAVAQNRSGGTLNPFADVTTNFFVDANSSSDENAPVNQAQVAAGVTLQKGAFNVQFTHSRAYSRYVDSYSGYVEPNFQGTVNNRITFGATFSPDIVNPPAASTVAVSSPSVPTQPTASVSSTSAIN